MEDRRHLEWFRDRAIMPSDTVRFRGSSVTIGTFRCAAESKWFADSGPAGHSAFAFPRISVRLRFGQGPPFAVTPNAITFYNRGQQSVREALDPRGAKSEWFAIAPDVLEEVLQRLGIRVADSERPFHQQALPCPPPLFAQQRRLVESLPHADPLRVEEESLQILEEVLVLQNKKPSPGLDHRASQEIAERAKTVLAQQLDGLVPLQEIAQRCGTSPFHLCRSFRRATGFTLHQFRRQLQLRESMEWIAQGSDLLELALRFGFSSHSHYSHAFRRSFGVAPSAFRRFARLNG